MSSVIPLSVVVITLNEEANLERCLKSVPFAAEKIVVDSFSTDRTLEIAKACGATVVQEKWRGYGAQKAFAASLAKNDWILSLDADEALSPELENELLEKFATLHPEVGYRLPRLSCHMKRWIRHGGWYPDFQLRLFHRKHSHWQEASLHEKVEAKRTENFRYQILHWVFKDISDQVRTNDKYSSVGAEDLHKRGKKFSLFHLLTKPPVKFIETYFLKQGFRDGLPGFIIAVGASYSIFLRWSKLWELQKKGSNAKS